jgi:hypothetical protein
MAAREAELEAWAQQRKAGVDVWPPKSPGERIAEALHVRVDDEAGTQYGLSVRTAGGSATELLSEWFFEPAMPPHVSAVSVTVSGRYGDESTIVASFPT